jgi:hypothetical protein
MPACALCDREVESFEDNIERWVLSVIKQQHPEWSMKDGACQQCVRHYESLGAVISLVQSHDMD